MTRLFDLRSPVVPALVLAVSLSLSGCSSPASPGTGADGGTSPDTAATSEPTTGATTVGPWEECPGIVAALNGNESDPTVYEEIVPTDFGVQEVGADVLASACVIGVTIGEDYRTWAILPGDDSLAASIKSDLANAGFVAGGAIPGMLGNPGTGQGVLVSSFATGAELDAYLVYPTAFTPIDEPIIYLGSFPLS